MFGETIIFYIKIWNHPIETTIYKWLFGVPGGLITPFFNIREARKHFHLQKKIRGLAGHFTRFLRHLHLLTNPEADRRKGQRHREDTFTPVVSDERHAADSRAVEREEVPEGSHRKKKHWKKTLRIQKARKTKIYPKKNTFKRQIHYPPLVTNQHKPPLKKWMDGWKTSITFPFFWGGMAEPGHRVRTLFRF